MKNRIEIKKLALIVTLFMFGLQGLMAQVSFSHAAGGKVFIGSGEGFEYSSFGILYSPRLNFVEIGDSSTLSLGTHLGLGFQGSYNSRDGGESSSFVFDVPVVVEFNFGQASNNDNDDGFGFYAGAGYGIHKSSDFGESFSGPVASAGLRFAIADRPLDVNLSYQMGTGDFKDFAILGIGAQYCFGL